MRSIRRCMIVIGFLTAVAVGAERPAEAAVGSAGTTSRAPTLKEQLEKGLKARRPQEFAFLAYIVGRVENGTLPRSLVNSTFLWARNKRPYPFPYFERGLRVRARRAGISL